MVYYPTYASGTWVQGLVAAIDTTSVTDTVRRTNVPRWSLSHQYLPPLLHRTTSAQTPGSQLWTSPKLRSWTPLQSPWPPPANIRARNPESRSSAPPPAECPEIFLLARAFKELLSDQKPNIGTKSQSRWTRV